MSTGAVHDPWADPPRSLPGDPPWEVALLYPTQGNWSEEEYLALQNRANLLVELSDGCIEVLPTPNPFHQWIVQFLYEALRAFVRGRFTGHVMTAPLPIRLAPGKYRDPDVIYLAPERITDPHQQPQGADLAMEIVSHSEKDRERDLVIKRKEYAQAGISEYWIVDPREHRITVLTLDGSAYRTRGEFGRGQMASSWLLAGFPISVDAVFAAGQSGI